MIRYRFPLALLALLMLTATAFAQGDVTVTIDPSLVELAFKGIAEGNWFLVAGPALTIVTLGVRWLLATKWQAIATSDRWGVAITAALAGAGALGHAWISGSTIAGETTLLGAAKVFVMAVATFVVTKKLVGAGGQYIKLFVREGETAADIAERIAAEMDPPKDKKPPANGGATGIVSLLLGVALLAGCKTGQGALEHVGSAAGSVIDCMTPEASDAIGAFGPALASVVRASTAPDGHVDWNPISDAARGLRTPAKQCVLAAAVKEALKVAAELVGGPQSAPAELDRDSLRAGWEAQRKLWGGATYKLEGGAL